MTMHAAEVRPDGSEIRWVEIAGDGPARVYLHGLGASAAPYFAEVVASPELRGPRTLLMDLLGFGISDRPADADYTLEDHADWVAAALRAAGVEQAEVVAHSMGGSVAILLAARHPGLVAKLVMIDSNLDPAPPVPPPGSASIARFSEREFLQCGGYEATLERVGRGWAATMRLGGREALYRTSVSLAAFSGRDALMGLTIPRTFLYPAADGEYAGADKLAASGVRMIAVPDCGHNVMVDNPVVFAREAAAALA